MRYIKYIITRNYIYTGRKKRHIQRFLDTGQCWLTGQAVHVASYGCYGNLLVFWKWLSFKNHSYIFDSNYFISKTHKLLSKNDNSTALTAFYAVTNIHNSFQCQIYCGSQVLFGHILHWPETDIGLCYSISNLYIHLAIYRNLIVSNSSYFIVRNISLTESWLVIMSVFGDKATHFIWLCHDFV